MHRALLNTSLTLAVLLFLPACSQLSSKRNAPDPSEGQTSVVPSGEAPTPPEQVQAEPVDPGGSLGLNDLIRLAIANSPELARAEGDVEVARAERAAVFIIEDPEWRTDYEWDDIREEQLGGDQIRRGESFNNRIRLYPPNPWVMRAEMATAMANIEVAEHVYRLASHDIATEVRRLYNEVQFREKQARLAGVVQETEEQELARLQELLNRNEIIRDDVIKQEVRAIGRRGNAAPNRSQVNQTKAELAALVGLNDPNRILVDPNTTMPRLEIHDDTVSVLSEIAYLNSPELAGIAAEESAAHGEIKTLNAAKIPWLSFIEVGDDIAYRDDPADGDRVAVSDTYMIRAAVNIPIFSHFSKEREIHKARIVGLRKEASRRRNQIVRRISSALKTIQAARTAYEAYEAETNSVMGELTSRKAEPHDITGVRLTRMSHLLDLEEAYNEAVITLEEVLRTDIATAFSGKNTAGNL